MLCSFNLFCVCVWFIVVNLLFRQHFWLDILITLPFLVFGLLYLLIFCQDSSLLASFWLWFQSSDFRSLYLFYYLFHILKLTLTSKRLFSLSFSLFCLLTCLVSSFLFGFNLVLFLGLIGLHRSSFWLILICNYRKKSLIKRNWQFKFKQTPRH